LREREGERGREREGERERERERQTEREREREKERVSEREGVFALQLPRRFAQKVRKEWIVLGSVRMLPNSHTPGPVSVAALLELSQETLERCQKKSVRPVRENFKINTRGCS
jgi:hypothetical protein